MYSTQIPWIDLYSKIQTRESVDSLVLEWCDSHPQEILWPSDFHHRTHLDWTRATQEDLWQLYAISRVTSSLLLSFQSNQRADGTDYPGPIIAQETFRVFHERLGFTVEDTVSFHPFYHEIIQVEQTPDDNANIEIENWNWPCLMLGNLMYCRAGCVIASGRQHVIKEVVEKSKLYWTFRRKDRHHHDESHGWGHNSQWRTEFRRDYRLNGQFFFNIDGDEPLSEPNDLDDSISREALIELVRNRCLVVTDAEDSNLYPYPYAYTEFDQPVAG